MRFGVSIETRGPHVRRESIVAIAEKAEELSFHSVWVSDHVIVPVHMVAVYPYRTSTTSSAGFSVESRRNYFESLMTLSYVAGRTRRVKIGVSVMILPYRNPVLTAKQVATLDVLSEGRFIFGVGVGWLNEEFEVMGSPPFEERGAVADEWVRIFKELWTKETSKYQGKYYSFAELQCYPKPVQQPYPPIWVGGHTRRAMERAIALGDGWQSARFWPEEYKGFLEQLREIGKRAGRSLESMDVAARCVLHLRDVPGLAEEMADGLPEPDISCTTAELVGYIQRAQEQGMNHIFFVLTSWRSLEERLQVIEHLAERVVPKVP